MAAGDAIARGFVNVELWNLAFKLSEREAMMRWTLKDLRLFAEIAEAGNLTRGAARVFLSPPAASARIKILEEDLGAHLLYRGNKGVTLTGAGETVLRHAYAILRQIAHLEDDLSGDPAAGGHVRIFANTTAVTEFLPEVLARFLADRPGVTIDLQEHLTRGIVRAVAGGTADLGIVSGEIDVTGIEARPFSTDRLVLVAAEGHPIAQAERMAFADTLGHEHVGLHEGSTLLAFLRSLIEQGGYDRALRLQVRSFEAMCRLVEAGVGIGVAPESAARRHAHTMAIRLITLTDPWAVRTRYVLARSFDALPSSARALAEDLVRVRAGGTEPPGGATFQPVRDESSAASSRS